ncbi:MAG: tetratricopeptide repeat protein [Verrucomicrobiota bacterium]
MTKRFSIVALLSLASLFVVSCGNDEGTIGLAGTSPGGSGDGEALYQKAKSLDDAGKPDKAVKLYAEVADDYAMSPSSGKARYRQAEILDQQGETLKSFKAYQQFLQRYQSSNLYSQALNSQVRMVQSAADGKVKSSFLGLRSKMSTKQIVEMLGQLRDNAPRSEISANAQFKIGELYQSEKAYKESIDAYRKLVRDQPETRQAAEALFRVGIVLLAQADGGNHNQATLDLAAEAFNDYLLQYPSHSKNGEARRLLGSLQGRDLDSSLEVAKFYDRTGEIESAKVYYRDIIKNSKSGSAHDYAKSRLKELGE